MILSPRRTAYTIRSSWITFHLFIFRELLFVFILSWFTSEIQVESFFTMRQMCISHLTFSDESGEKTKKKTQKKHLKSRAEFHRKNTLQQSKTAQITKNRWQEQELTADANVGACWTGVFLRRGVSSGLFVVVLCFGQVSA